MFEAHVLHLLRRYLGEYVHGLSAEALRISVWKGDVVLKDLKLKAEALNSLKLPVRVRAGFVGTVTLKVPWKSLGKEPVIVLIDRVFILAQPVPDGRTLREEDREKLLETKLQQIEETEFATLEAISKSKLGNASNGNSWLGSLIATIIGNLKISISNVHIRYEDSISNPGHPFCSGVTLAKLAAVTMDEQGKETFDTSGALDKLRKSLQLERLAMYHDSNSLPWTIDKRWEDLNPKEWIEIFEDGINEPSGDCIRLSKWAMNRHYLVSPINGNLKYHRLGNQERNNPELPFEKASVVLSNVAINITEMQYHDWIKLLEVISRYQTYIEVSHLRPVVPVLGASFLWWRYAVQASLQQKKMCYRFSWDRIQHLCQLRRQYIQLYAGSLQRLSNINIAEIREIEKDLDSKVILLWRLLAHAKLESVKSKEAAGRRRLKKGSWFPFVWGTNTNDMSDDSSEGSQVAEELFTREEWQAVNKLLSFQPDELMSHSGKDSHNMIQFLVTVTVGQAAARIFNVNGTEIVCGRFEQLHVSTKFKHRSTQCDVLLKYYGLSAPEGSLAQSVCSEQKVNALVASFVRSPVGENVDWRLSATISPCHVTILMESCDRFLEFVKRSNAVSPTVALETATALQMKLERVTRRAQEQIQMVFEEQSRFALDIDFDAPKVRVPIKTCCFSNCDSHFLLDFGHFTLHTMESQLDQQRQNIYSRFYISGRDIAALFTDCGSECHKSDDNDSTVISSVAKADDSVYSLVDRCGIAVLVDQVKVPHPKYPSTRIFIQVPNLNIHFSPARYRRIMELLNILYGTMKNYGQPSVQNSQADLALWGLPEFSVDARILVWRGIGNSVATWHSCFIALSGFYLYLLDGAKSQSYQRYISMAGKQVHEVPPTNVGGSLLCIAVSSRGLDIYQALESSSTWVLQFKNEEEKAIWLKALVLATYQASAPLSVDILSKTNSDSSDYIEAEDTNLKTANLVINGTLMEARLFIYGKTGYQNNEKHSEMLILEVLATGGKVHTIHCDSNLTIKMKLHSLKIKDELQGCLSRSSPYLACSVLQKGKLFASSVTSDSLKKEISSVVPEDEDTFKDAFPDFLSLGDGGICVQNMATPKLGIYSDINDATGFESSDTLFYENDFRRGGGNSGEIFYEAEGCDNSDFVSIMFLTRTPDSSGYDGIDTQLSIRMSKLEFYCNRPTLVALIDFGLDLSSVNNVENYPDSATALEEKSNLNEAKTEEKGRVRGLLGYGKVRVVFYLNMNVDSVSVFLNKEDGSQLAMLVQESFLLDLKVHPSSLSIEGMLGNFRLCDLSLETDQCWSWLCDIRNPGVDSLIKFKFDSFSSEDDDYKGYDYSLSGRLSGVRIVFLYRFVQEIMVYFMELATPHSEEAIKLVDKVGGFEWLIQKYEMDGAVALKLDLSLDTPIIILPQNSKSKDFIQLDLGQLQVKNEFSWHGCPEKDASAVHLDILCAEILGINMSVGINGSLGKPMIREGWGIEVFVRRSLRDVFRKVPTFSIEVKVGLLHGVMSEREYKVILDCTYMNLNEEPRLPPSFRGSKAVRNDTMRLLVDKVNTSSQILLSRTVTIITVAVDSVFLELCNGIQEESPLALLSVEGLWVSYRMTSLSETDLYVTIPKFSVVDIRADTNAEMRLMLGSLVDTCRQNYMGKFPFSNKDLYRRTKSESALDVDLPISTMFLMDYRWRRQSQSFVIRVQQPRILVVPDFLLAVVEFFVPAFGTMTGREETMDPRNDPIRKNENIVLTERIHKQSEDVVQLSSCRQLVADSVGIDDYIYDGVGKVIYLSEETHEKECHSLSFRPLIIIGRGKRLRFLNVRIENGFLLRKYVYLSNDSCFSVSPEDGVDVVLLDTSSIDDNTRRMDSFYEASDSSSSSYSENDLHMKQTFTFETQVVSPEFTFYDDTKSSLVESVYSEKLLRAKLDISFMYASKENDTWIRATVKDFNIESGSGLIILDPIDISGGYTSMKDKTNLSIVSTDISIHLSLSAISLILNLENQATGAFQFGSAIPLVPCTNFNQIWVSPKENGFYPNLSFWRPRPPSNYVVLGDCVTSRPVPPSQAVMAVSNTYGRVRRPIGFNLIGMFPGIQGFGADEDKLDADACFLWQPVAPSGYVAVGCVAHIGNQPPPNHFVYCIRSDLLTSTLYSDCIFNAPSNKLYPSGFSIWRLENVFGSFTAHASADFPAKSNACDLNYLLWNSNLHCSSFKESTPNVTPCKASSSQDESDCTASLSGWDILRSISKGSNCYVSTPNFERIWWDKGNDLRRPVSIWRPISRPGYVILGDCITEGLEPPAFGILFKDDNLDVSAKPVQFTKVAHIMGRGLEEAFFWYPIAPPGYASLGCVVTKTGEVPPVNSFCCPRIDIVCQASIVEVPMSRSSNARASQSWSIWKVDNQARTFLARSDLKKPSKKLAFTFADSVKPKTRENITAELKFRCFSVTVLDGLCGRMTPIFNTTVTDVKLATQGRLESMNAVLVSSIAASTFNTQLEEWEPLVEPFDGIFKFETYDGNKHPPSKLGKRFHIATTSILNLNISAANIDSLVGSIMSWRRQVELDQKANNLNEGSLGAREGESTFSALDLDELQTVIIENKLGCDIYLKKVEQNLDTVDCLHHGDCATLWIPPPVFSYSLNVTDDFREARFYVAVQIIQAKGLPIVNDGNSHYFFCALRLVIESEATDQQKLFPQSARTKCVNPLISKINDRNEGTAKWNELFIFELSRKAPSKLEVEVTNLAAKAGKGEVVGAFSFSVGPGPNELKKVASVRMLNQMYDARNIVSYPLRRTVQQNNLEEALDRGSVMVSTSYFEKKPVADGLRNADSDIVSERDIGFWMGLGPEGEWHSIRSLLPLTVVPKSLEKDHIVMEILMKNGKKHAIFRGLATLINDSDVELKFSICHVSNIRGLDSSTEQASLGTVVEEIFENQCYRPTLGWSNNHDAVGPWSNRDFSYMSKDFFEPRLPSGWRWTSTWCVERSQLVDNDGWAYGPEFLSVMWPLTSSKSCRKSNSDNVRRRRWTRTRQQSSELDGNTQSDLLTLNPGCSSVLPWRCTSKDSDECLLVRPFVDHSTPSYSWGRSVITGSVYACEKDQAFVDHGSLGSQGVSKLADKGKSLAFKLNQLEKKDILLCCYSGSKQFWLSMGADASVLHTELNAPVYDWKISVNSPLKLENRLPCPTEFTIWEKTKEGNCIQRQQGLISSRQSVCIYSADIQKQIYLTLFVQGGWRLEKDAVLVLDPLLSDHVSSFWMVHQKNRRRLRVSIERDMGGTSAAPKTIRFFVPYWIMNDSSLSLAYRVVEVEPYENDSSESFILQRAKSAKTTLKNPSGSVDRRFSSLRRNIQVFEVIEDTSPVPSMLSPQDSVGRSGATLFTSQKDAYRRVGITVAIQHSEIYSPGISLLELENKVYDKDSEIRDTKSKIGILTYVIYYKKIVSGTFSRERVDVKAFSSDGSYYKLSALLNMTSDRTKVIHFQPHTLFINRVGYSLCLQQCESQLLTWLHPTDPPKHFEWQSSAVELLKLRVDGYEWSTPFSVLGEGAMEICLNKDTGNGILQLRVNVRSGAKSSRNEVIFRPHSTSSAYRIENRTMIFPIRFRQVDDTCDTWKFLPPNAAVSFLWEDLGRRHMLEVLVDGTDPLKSDKYNIDEISDHQPIASRGGPTKPLRVSIIKEEKMNIVKISDWIPENEPTGFPSLRSQQTLSQLSKGVDQTQDLPTSSDREFHVVFELPELGISLIDHTPEEILYLSVQSLFLSHSCGLGSGISRFELKMRGIQVDNQLPLSPMPVLFRPQRSGEDTDYVLKFSVTNQSNGSLDLCVYPYIGLQGPENSAFLINIHEPIIWRLHEMIQQVNLSRLHESQSSSVSVDPIIQIGVLNISEVRFKVSMAMSPSQRPRGLLGFWSSLMTALGNTENMPVRINQKFRENICMRQSLMISIAVSNIRKDILSQPLQLLSGVDILGNASSALGHMSKGVAALSMDKKFIQGRQRQENKGVEDFGDIIREGGGALAKGLFRGVTGILTKPLEGAKSSGVEGFVQGVGKGIIGAAAQPVSGVLDLLSKTTEGANAMRMKIASAITSDEQLLRRRLPRVISGDNLIRLYDEFKARGQVILQLAESGSFFLQVDLFKVRGKFALSDAYEDHFLLPKGKIIMITHRRVVLLQQPSAIIAQRKFSPAKDPCSVLWDVSWGDLMTMELTHGKKDQPKAPPSQLILYLQTRSAEWKDQVRIIKCSRDTHQALQVYSSIEQAMNIYGRNVSKEMYKRKVRKPYSPSMEGGDGALLPRESPSDWSPQQVPASVPLSSTFGSGSDF